MVLFPRPLSPWLHFFTFALSFFLLRPSVPGHRDTPGRLDIHLFLALSRIRIWQKNALRISMWMFRYPAGSRFGLGFEYATSEELVEA